MWDALALVGKLGDSIALRQLQVAIIPELNHFGVTNNPDDGIVRGDLPATLDPLPGYVRVADPIVNFLALQLGLNPSLRVARARELLAQSVDLFTPWAIGQGLGNTSAQLKDLTASAAASGPNLPTAMVGKFIPYLTFFEQFTGNNNPFPY